MPKDSNRDSENLLDGILGLGKESGQKSYYPALQRTINELEEEQRKFKEIFENTVDLLAIISLEGIVEWVNQTAVDKVGTSADEIVGVHFAETPWWNFDAAIQARLRNDIELAAMGEVVNRTTKNACREGFFHVNFTLKPMRNSEGDIDRLLADGRDITDLVIAENEIRDLNENLEKLVKDRTDELQTAYTKLMDARSRLMESEELTGLAETTAKVAHELSTPLGMVNTAYSRLKELLSENSDETVIELLTIIDSNLERSQKLTKSFQNLAADQASESRRVFELQKVLDETFVTMGGRLARYKQKIHISCPSGLVMDSFPGALTHILINLITNSRKHGYPEKSPGRIDIIVEDKDSRVLLIYKDNGCGMDETVKSHAFEPFFTTGRNQDNTGLGLSLVYNLATRTLGGTVELNSNPGQGVEFKLDFPKSAS